MIPEAGPGLDAEVSRRLREQGPLTPPYSTDPHAADRLAARLEKSGVFATCERMDQLWYCALSILVGDRRERVATGTGTTRPLALCRAVLNLPGRRPLAESPKPLEG